MLSSLRLTTLLFAAVNAQQDDKVKSVARQHLKPVESLMESAKNFLKNGATPDVVDFAEATLNEVSGIVIPAIENESITDQAFIMKLHSRFGEILGALANGNTEIRHLNWEERNATNAHKTCRSTTFGGMLSEEQKCTEKRECEMKAYVLWKNWVDEEEELKRIHNGFDGHFCLPGSNGTLGTFRTASVPWMEEYITQKTRTDEAEHHYDIHIPNCTVTHNSLTEKSTLCNNKQTELEDKAYAHASKINQVLAQYYNDWAQASSAYNCAVQEIKELERDRHREWVTLQVVNCLLERVHEQNGRPCDSETGEVQEHITFCEQRHALSVCDATEGNTILCLNYPPPLEIPPFCPTRNDVVGHCLPQQVPYPCDDDWDVQQYDSLLTVDGENLRSWPEAEYSETNPGCNAWQKCSSRAPLVVPTYVEIDSCPGYTTDECMASINGDVPFNYVRSVEGSADVVCCSIDGDTCVSQLQSGLDFLPASARNTHGCVSGVSYQAAMSVCNANGMRICNKNEVQSCCNDVCGQDASAVWVDINGDQIGNHALNMHREGGLQVH